MPQYYLNQRQQPNGDYEVHQDPCHYMPSSREDLGYHTTCHGAVAEAKRRHPTWYRINGCAFCSNPCHTT